MSQDTLTLTNLVEPADLQVILAAWTEATDRLQKTHELLQEEVRRLTVELEQKNRELARQNRLADLGQMASHIAHEVRNGLLPMKLYLSLLRRKTTKNADATEICDKVTASVGALETIVNDLLQFSADRDAQVRPMDCGALFHEIVEALAPQFAAQRITVQTSVAKDLHLIADPDMLRRGILNLVLNAVDVLSQGGELNLSAMATSDGWELSVADNGPGISADILPRLFDPFFTTKATGTGLGLAIVERIAEAHHGTLTAANGPQGGAIFTLHLPRAIAASKEAA